MKRMLKNKWVKVFDIKYAFMVMQVQIKTENKDVLERV